MKKDLTTMTKISPSSKEYFDNELDFNKYLMTEDGISVLSDTLDINLGNPIKEQTVESNKRIDLVYEVEGENDERLIVESQFYKSNHDHLGKLISYTSQSETYKHIAWIIEDVEDIHISAIKMLNQYFNYSDNPKYFYIVKAEVLMIDGQGALNLELLEKPDVEEIMPTNNKKVHESALLQQAFWHKFNSFIKEKGGAPKKSPAQHWLNFTLDNKKDKISNGSYTVSPKQGWLRVTINYRKEIGDDQDISNVIKIYSEFEKHFNSKGYKTNYTNREDRSISTFMLETKFDMNNYGSVEFEWMLEAKDLLEEFVKELNI